eukprot:2949462-Rhodomonas_salina.2
MPTDSKPGGMKAAWDPTRPAMLSAAASTVTKRKGVAGVRARPHESRIGRRFKNGQHSGDSVSEDCCVREEREKERMDASFLARAYELQMSVPPSQFKAWLWKREGRSDEEKYNKPYKHTVKVAKEGGQESTKAKKRRKKGDGGTDEVDEEDTETEGVELVLHQSRTSIGCTVWDGSIVMAKVCFVFAPALFPSFHLKFCLSCVLRISTLARAVLGTQRTTAGLSDPLAGRQAVSRARIRCVHACDLRNSAMRKEAWDQRRCGLKADVSLTQNRKPSSPGLHGCSEIPDCNVICIISSFFQCTPALTEFFSLVVQLLGASEVVLSDTGKDIMALLEKNVKVNAAALRGSTITVADYFWGHDVAPLGVKGDEVWLPHSKIKYTH